MRRFNLTFNIPSDCGFIEKFKTTDLALLIEQSFLFYYEHSEVQKKSEKKENLTFEIKRKITLYNENVINNIQTIKRNERDNSISFLMCEFLKTKEGKRLVLSLKYKCSDKVKTVKETLPDKIIDIKLFSNSQQKTELLSRPVIKDINIEKDNRVNLLKKTQGDF